MSEAKKMEEEIKALRKDVDYLKKNMVDPDSIMTEDDFEKQSDTGQVYLKKDALKLFVKHY